MNKTLHHIKHSFSRTAAGLHIEIRKDNSIVGYCCVLEKKKGQVKIKKQFSVSNLDELPTKLPVKTPLFIIVNGKGVVHKKIQENKSTDIKDIVHSVLPSANVDDLFVQTCDGKDGRFVSFVRKNIPDKLVREIHKQQYSILKLYLGPYKLNTILPVLKTDEHELSLSFFLLKIKNSGLSDFEVLPESQYQDISMPLDNEQINDKYVLPFAAALNYFLPRDDDDVRFYQDIIQDAGDFSFRILLKPFMVAVLILFFTVLLLNYFIFSNFQNKYNELSFRNAQKTNLIRQISELEQELDTKQALIAGTGLSSSPRLSFYADRIAASLPPGIRLTDLNIRPLSKKLEPNEKAVFESYRIRINGVSKKSGDFSRWVKSLQEKEWVMDIRIIERSQKDLGSSTFFGIEIIVEK
jgi:Tfp pilus assembly protein PilN